MKNKKIQIIRAVFAIMVVLIHTLPSNFLIKSIIRPFLNVAVAGFIFLSGYLTKTSIDAKQFYKKRILTVLIPYVIFTAIHTIIRTKSLDVDIIIPKFVKNVITTQGNATLYFFAVYIQFVILAPLLVKIAKQKNAIMNTLIFMIQPLFMLFFYIGVSKGVIQSESPWYIMFFPVWITYYYLGILIGNDLTKIRVKNYKLAIMAIIGLVSQVVEGVFWLNNTIMKDMYFTQIRFTALIENIPLLLLIVVYIRSPKETGNKILEKIGDASFGIYLVHPFIIMICDKILCRNTNTFIITFATTLVLSYLTVAIVNKFVPKNILKYTGLLVK